MSYSNEITSFLNDTQIPFSRIEPLLVDYESICIRLLVYVYLTMSLFVSDIYRWKKVWRVRSPPASLTSDLEFCSFESAELPVSSPLVPPIFDRGVTA